MRGGEETSWYPDADRDNKIGETFLYPAFEEPKPLPGNFWQVLRAFSKDLGSLSYKKGSPTLACD